MDVSSDRLTTSASKPQTQLSLRSTLTTFPWYVLVLVLVGIWVYYAIATTETYHNIFSYLTSGIIVTLSISFVAYFLSIVIGLLIGLIRANPPGPRSGLIHVILYNIASLYVETMRGLPMLVTLLIVAFVGVPEVIRALAGLGVPITVRDVPDEWRAVIAITLVYSAFMSETFRAGIQSIERGQIDACRSLGMRPLQALRYVILPQAVRRMLPPLGNDLIAMIKDSSLVAILGVRDVTQLAKLSSSQSFLYLQTYLIAATIYLTMTLIGTILVRLLERRMRLV